MLCPIQPNKYSNDLNFDTDYQYIPTAWLSTCKSKQNKPAGIMQRGPEYVERGIISSFTMICKSEKKSLCYLGSRNHPQRTSANFFLFFDTPSPLTHFCTFVATLYDKTSFIDTPLDDSLFAWLPYLYVCTNIDWI